MEGHGGLPPGSEGMGRGGGGGGGEGGGGGGGNGGGGGPAHQAPPHAQPSAVRGFVAGKGVLITGSTGFLGKVLIEKLLRTCPEVGPIFLLIRRRGDQGPCSRLETEIVASKCFDRLRNLYPLFAKHLFAVEGDVAKPWFGLSESDLRNVQETCSLVFHCAATVKFNEHLCTAMEINVDAVKHLVQLSRSLRRVDAVVHVSTAYVSHPNLGESGASLPIMEAKGDADGAPNRPIFGYQELRERIEGLSREQVSDRTSSILASFGGFPNTYCLTKHMGEAMLRGGATDGLPVIILRPTIVTCAAQQPSVGWTDTLVGPAGLVLAVAFGALHAAPGGGEKIVDFVPVDYVINSIVACAYYCGAKMGDLEGRRGDPMVVHCGTSCDNPICWSYMLKVMPGYYARHPSPRTHGSIFFRWAETRLQWLALNALLHTFPAMMLDCRDAVLGGKGGNRRKMAKISQAIGQLEYFTYREWRFDSSNLAKVRAALPPQDMDAFYTDVGDIVWDCYFEGWSHGMKVYLLKEAPEYVKAGGMSRL